jgi:hypothetical protein
MIQPAGFILRNLDRRITTRVYIRYMCRVAYKLWGSGVVGYFSVAASASMLIENFRSIKDARSIGKPDQDPVVKTVCFQQRMGSGQTVTSRRPKRV